MWQKFSESARKAVFYSQEAAQKFGEGYVSTEHLLLGLLKTNTTAVEVLAKLGHDPEVIAEAVVKHLPTKMARPVQDMMLTPRSKRVIDLAYDEARNLNDHYIGTEHLLLGLVREEDGLAGRVLAGEGILLEEVRRTVMEVQAKAPRVAPEPPPSFPARPRLNSYPTSALLAIRQSNALPDLIALAILAEQPKALVLKLESAGISVRNLTSHLEALIANGHLACDREPVTIEEVLKGAEGGIVGVFLAIASNPSTFTFTAVEEKGITTEQLQSAFRE